MATLPAKTAMKDRILETADRLFYLQGIHAIGVDTIAAEIGISKRTLYNHFPSKDALIAAYLERRFVAPRPSEKPPVEQILGTFDSLERRFSAKDFRGCPFVNAVAELGVERLLLSDPDLATTIIERELGALLADPRMGEELVETLQVYVDAGGNRRETARRLHLADRTVAYRLERAEQLLGHGFDGDDGRRLNVALTLRRLARARQPTSD